MRQPAEDMESNMVDLREVALADLPECDAEALDTAMAGLFRRIDDPNTITSGYNPQRAD